jgi:hypothetical protein
MVEAKYFYKTKIPRKKYYYKLFCFRGFHYKCHFQYAFYDNLSVTHVFIKQIFRAVELAPPFPLPLTGLCRGWGSSGSFQPQAVALVKAMKQ